MTKAETSSKEFIGDYYSNSGSGNPLEAAREYASRRATELKKEEKGRKRNPFRQYMGDGVYQDSGGNNLLAEIRGDSIDWSIGVNKSLKGDQKLLFECLRLDVKRLTSNGETELSDLLNHLLLNLE